MLLFNYVLCKCNISWETKNVLIHFMLWYLLYCISLKWNSQYLCGVPIHVSLLLCWVFSPMRSQHPPPGVREEFLTQLSDFYNSSGVHNKVPKTLLSFVKYFNVTSCKGFTLAFEILLQINIFVRYIYIFIIYFSLHTTRKWLYISIFLSYFPFKIEVTLRWWYRLCVKIYLDLWPTWQIYD